jgi:hypothetical protein
MFDWTDDEDEYADEAYLQNRVVYYETYAYSITNGSTDMGTSWRMYGTCRSGHA